MRCKWPQTCYYDKYVLQLSILDIQTQISISIFIVVKKLLPLFHVLSWFVGVLSRLQCIMRSRGCVVLQLSTFLPRSFKEHWSASSEFRTHTLYKLELGTFFLVNTIYTINTREAICEFTESEGTGVNTFRNNNCLSSKVNASITVRLFKKSLIFSTKYLCLYVLIQ